jgi:hypothetical protein
VVADHHGPCPCPIQDFRLCVWEVLPISHDLYLLLETLVEDAYELVRSHRVADRLVSYNLAMLDVYETRRLRRSDDWNSTARTAASLFLRVNLSSPQHQLVEPLQSQDLEQQWHLFLDRCGVVQSV